MRTEKKKGDCLSKDRLDAKIFFEGMGNDGLPRYRVDLELPAIAPSNLVTQVRLIDYDGKIVFFTNEEGEE